MTFNEYQERTGKTAIYKKAVYEMIEPLIEPNERFKNSPKLAALSQIEDTLNLFYAGMGLGEAGEAQNKIKKIIRDNKGVVSDEARQAIGKEIGGLLWYCSQVAAELGLKLGEIAEENVNILKSRSERGVLKGAGDER